MAIRNHQGRIVFACPEIAEIAAHIFSNSPHPAAAEPARSLEIHRRIRDVSSPQRKKYREATFLTAAGFAAWAVTLPWRWHGAEYPLKYALYE